MITSTEYVNTVINIVVKYFQKKLDQQLQFFPIPIDYVFNVIAVAHIIHGHDIRVRKHGNGVGFCAEAAAKTLWKTGQ